MTKTVVIAAGKMAGTAESAEVGAGAGEEAEGTDLEVRREGHAVSLQLEGERLFIYHLFGHPADRHFLPSRCRYGDQCDFSHDPIS